MSDGACGERQREPAISNFTHHSHTRTIHFSRDSAARHQSVAMTHAAPPPNYARNVFDLLGIQTQQDRRV